MVQFAQATAVLNLNALVTQRMLARREGDWMYWEKCKTLVARHLRDACMAKHAAERAPSYPPPPRLASAARLPPAAAAGGSSSSAAPAAESPPPTLTAAQRVRADANLAEAKRKRATNQG